MDGLSVCCGCCDRCAGHVSDPVDAHRLGDVLQTLRADVFEHDLNLALDVIIGGAGDQDAARLGDRLQPRCDVDAVAIEVAALDHDVAEIDTDAQDDVAILGLTAVRGGHALLQIDGALHGVDGAGELDQHAVAGHLEDAALMLGDQWLQHLLAPGLERGQRAGLIVLHQPAVADHVGGQDGSEAALDAFFGHGLQ